MSKRKSDKPEVQRRRKKGTGTVLVRHGKYEIRWREDGKVKQEATGLKATKDNRAKAEELLAKKTLLKQLITRDEELTLLLKEKEDLQQKIARLQAIANGKSALTLGGLVQAFVDSPRRPDCSTAQLAKYKAQLGAFVEWLKDDSREFASIDDACAEAYTAHLVSKLAGGTVNKHLMALSCAWRVLGRAEGVTTNPWDSIPRRRKESHSRRVLEQAEIDKVLSTAKGELRDLICIGLRLGLRLGDACRLRWESFQQDGTVVVPTTKTGVNVRLPSAWILADLGRTATSGFVLPNFAAQYNRCSIPICNQVSRLFKKCGIKTQAKDPKWKRARPDATYHSLRHTFVTRAMTAGIPIAIVQALVGHESPATTNHYTHLDANTVCEAFRKANM